MDLQNYCALNDPEYNKLLIFRGLWYVGVSAGFCLIPFLIGIPIAIFGLFALSNLKKRCKSIEEKHREAWRISIKKQ